MKRVVFRSIFLALSFGIALGNLTQTQASDDHQAIPFLAPCEQSLVSTKSDYQQMSRILRALRAPTLKLRGWNISDFLEIERKLKGIHRVSMDVLFFRGLIHALVSAKPDSSHWSTTQASLLDTYLNYLLKGNPFAPKEGRPGLVPSIDDVFTALLARDAYGEVESFIDRLTLILRLLTSFSDFSLVGANAQLGPASSTRGLSIYTFRAPELEFATPLTVQSILNRIDSAPGAFEKAERSPSGQFTVYRGQKWSLLVNWNEKTFSVFGTNDPSYSENPREQTIHSSIHWVSIGKYELPLLVRSLFWNSGENQTPSMILVHYLNDGNLPQYRFVPMRSSVGISYFEIPGFHISPTTVQRVTSKDSAFEMITGRAENQRVLEVSFETRSSSGMQIRPGWQIIK